MRNLILFILILCLSGLISGCSPQQQTSNMQEYLKWLNKQENQLVKRKYVNGMEITVKYLPPDFLTFREIQNDPAAYKTKDSLLAIYAGSMNFLMTLGPDEREAPGPDVMFSGVVDYKDYTSRVVSMNFEMEKYIKLNVNGGEYRPVLSAMENIYSLNTKRNILFAFVPMSKSDNDFHDASKIDFVYEDELFDLGVNHFVFKRSDIENRLKLAMN